MGNDILGFYDKDNNIFYCEMFEFLDKFNNKLKDFDSNNNNNININNTCYNNNNYYNDSKKNKAIIKTNEELKEKFDKIYI